MSIKEIQAELQSHILILTRTVDQYAHIISELVDIICQCFQHGNKLLLCGNGGSAADAQHVAAEFVNRFRFDRPALPAIALTTDSSILTCVGNDSSFDRVFSRQIEALAQQGDILAAISTSGNSVNVLNALDVARAKKITTIGFTGEKGEATFYNKCDRCLVVPSVDTARIQEVHEFSWHVICGMVEEHLFNK
jgi:D-sedoheptulose 7-phosphate isomerase